MKNVENLAVEILKKQKYEHEKYAYISAYQLAVLIYKEDSTIFSDLEIHHLGGRGTGEHSSWAQYLARNLAHDNIEYDFFHISGLGQFSFEDEKGILREASSKSFSIFKYTTQKS